MQRTIVTSPALAPAALAELKQWLGITTTADDAPLTALLGAAVETCEAFTGALPLEAECEEVVTLSGLWPRTWRRLVTRPVQAVTGVEALSASGVRTPLAPEAYAVDLDADGGARVRVSQPGGAMRIVVRFTAGIAPEWSALPDGLRQGIMRLAAHQHRARDGDGAAPLPPAAVAALWRPWRRLRLA
jgi:uncharacterized phiE125 gp8 family phage protein